MKLMGIHRDAVSKSNLVLSNTVASQFGLIFTPS